jgi:hypothetical protein
MVASHHIFGKCCKLTSPAALHDTSCMLRLCEGATAVNANSVAKTVQVLLNLLLTVNNTLPFAGRPKA